MESVNLNAGWLEKQIKSTQKEVGSWPSWLQTNKEHTMTDRPEQMVDGTRDHAGYPFSYDLSLTCTIAGREYEFSKVFRSPSQHHVGDMFNIGVLEGRVETIVWYMNDPGHGFIQLEDLKLDGVPSDWEWLLEYFDDSTPDLLG